MRKILSLILLVTLSSPSGFMVNSTVISEGRPATARSSSSMTPTKKKRRCVRRSLPAPKM
jgi:hypothetical protein